MIQTKRLIIDQIRQEDEAAVVALFTDEVVKKTYMVPDFENREQIVKLFERMQQLSLQEDRFVRGIYLDKEMIGLVNDVGIEGKEIELGYAFLSKYHNCGYGTEMLEAVISHLLKEGFKEVKTAAFEENKASLRVMEKAGMEKIDFTEEIEYRGNVHKCVYYSKKK